MKLGDVAVLLANSKKLLTSYYKVDSINISKTVRGKTCNRVFVTFNISGDVYRIDILKFKGKTYMISDNIMKEVAMINCLSSYKGNTSLISEEMVKYIAHCNRVNFAKGRFVTVPKNQNELLVQLKNITSAYNSVRVLYTESIKDAKEFDRSVSKNVAVELDIKREKDGKIDFDDIQGK